MKPSTIRIFLVFLIVTCFFKAIPAKNSIPLDSLFIYLNDAIKTKDQKKACLYAHQIGAHYWINGKIDSSIIYSQKALELAIETKDTTFQIKAITTLAYDKQQQGNLEEAIELFNNAISLSEKLRDTLLWANSLENMSVIFGATGCSNYPKALELLLKAAKLKEDFGAFDMLPGTYKNISVIFKEVKDTLNREKYLLKAVNLVEQGKVVNPTFKAAVYNEAGRFYTDEKPDYIKADDYFTKVLEISKQLNWKKGISASLSNKANLKELQGDYKNALELLSESLKLKTEIKDFYGIVNTYHSMGEIFQKLHDYKQSIGNYEKSLKLALEKNLSNELNKNFEGLYTVYREMGNYKTSLEYFEKYTSLSDSLTGVNHKNVVAELETKYQTEKKEQQIEKLTTEKQIESLKARQRKLIAFILGSLLVLIALLAYFIIRQKNLKNSKRESELNQKLLRSQMNPHFIFNALGTIQNYIYNNRADDAGKYLAKFAKLMRNILESSINEQIPIDKEIETVTCYLTLQQIRSSNNFQFEVNVEGSLHDELIPPMLVQPFIENSIKHAFNPDDLGGKITVRYIFSKEEVSIIVEDNGVGINSKKRENEAGHKSYAIQLTRERLSLYNKQNSISGSIDITDLSETGGKGTRVTINFKQI
jgi:tetratricopeptide (TPR) repeat protein